MSECISAIKSMKKMKKLIFFYIFRISGFLFSTSFSGNSWSTELFSPPPPPPPPIGKLNDFVLILSNTYYLDGHIITVYAYLISDIWYWELLAELSELFFYI